jgi:predicted dienelactone hydrolase
VVAPPHPGNTILDGASCGAFQSLVASALERPQDMIFVLNQILAADADPGSDFFGVVDESRIGMSGHSFGGLTTYLVQPNEPRITVAMPMAPATSSNSRLTVPSLTMRGAIDSVVNNANILAAYGRSSSPKILADIEYAGHYAFSNLCFPGSDCSPPATLTQDEAHAAVLRYAVPFLQVYLRGDASWSQLLEAPAGPGFVVTSE